MDNLFSMNPLFPAYCAGFALHSTFGVSVTTSFPFPSRIFAHVISSHSVRRERGRGRERERGREGGRERGRKGIEGEEERREGWREEGERRDG